MGELTTSTEEVPSFTYSGLADPDRDWLRRAAADLRLRLRRTVKEVFEVGKVLAAARRRLGRDRWRPWLASEAQIPIRSACRLVAVGQVFGGMRPEVVDQFTPTALYALSEPGVPQSLREFAVEQAAEGEEVTAARVKEWLEAYRDTRLDAPVKLASKDEALPTGADPGKVFAAENWQLLLDMLGVDNTLHLSTSSDLENADLTASGVLIDAKGGVRRATAGTVEAVVLKLSGGTRKKVCPMCGENKPLDEFCTRRDLPDGREYRCKLCERKRVKDYTTRKAAESRKAG